MRKLVLTIFVVMTVVIVYLYYQNTMLSSKLVNLIGNIDIIEQMMPNISKAPLSPAESRVIANQLSIIRNVISREGVYSHRRSDRGGETVYGISRVYFPKHPIWKQVDSLKKKVKKGTTLVELIKKTPSIRQMAEMEYLSKFKKYGLNELPLQTADIIFDTFVNVGFTKGPEFVQIVCNSLNQNHKYGNDLTVDGNFGKMSRQRLIAVVKDHRHHFEQALLGVRDSHYVFLAAKSTKQREHTRGWLNRRDK